MTLKDQLFHLALSLINLTLIGVNKLAKPNMNIMNNEKKTSSTMHLSHGEVI